MASPLLAICDALAGSLTGTAMEIASTTVQRRNWAAVSAEDMTHPIVFVTPGGIQSERIGRTQHQTDYTANVFLGRHVTADADADGMLDLAEEILALVRAHNWQSPWPYGVTSPISVSIEINPDDALDERNVWRAVISATYRVCTTET
jgi:hypothetical protein